MLYSTNELFAWYSISNKFCLVLVNLFLKMLNLRKKLEAEMSIDCCFVVCF